MKAERRKRLHRIIGIVAATMIQLAAADLGAQSTVKVSGGPSCPTCKLTFSPVTTLGTQQGGSIDSEFAHVAVDSRHRFYVYQLGTTEIKVFDRAGKFLQLLGRRGSGPGEFQDVGSVKSIGDSIHVHDRSLSTVSVFGPDLKFVRATRWEVAPTFTSAAFLHGGSMVISQKVSTLRRTGFPLHLIGPDGRLLASFGSAKGAYRPDIPDLASRSITSAGGDQVWSAHRSAYRIDLVDGRTGLILKHLVREASWFPDGERPVRTKPAANAPPRPRISAVHRDETGLLWILISVADARWKSAVSSGNPSHPTITDPLRYWDSIIEVIDPEKATVVASIRLDEAPGWFVSGNLFQRVVTRPDGAPIIKIDRVGLSPR